MSEAPHIINDRYVVANGSTGALTIPFDFRKALDVRPGMFCNLTCQADGTLLVQVVTRDTDGSGGLSFQVKPFDLPYLPKRPHVEPVMTIAAKDVVRNGPKSPAFTINNEIAKKIGLKIHDPVLARLYSDGSMVFQLMEKVETGNTTRLTPVVLDLGREHHAPSIPAGISLHRRPAHRRANG
jgi:antitoxin component of MazEF toxin-antitoxin module